MSAIAISLPVSGQSAIHHFRSLATEAACAESGQTANAQTRPFRRTIRVSKSGHSAYAHA